MVHSTSQKNPSALRFAPGKTRYLNWKNKSYAPKHVTLANSRDFY